MKINEVKPKLKPGKKKPLNIKAKEFEKKFGLILKKDCKKILDLYLSMNNFGRLDPEDIEWESIDDYNLLFRGTKRKNPPAYLASPPKNRKPVDTGMGLHNELNQVLSLAGYKATRGNSIFTSGSYGQARDYGQVYVIFPVDGFNFSWSPKHEDLYSDLLDSVSSLSDIVYGGEGDRVDDRLFSFADVVDRLNDLYESFLEDFPTKGKTKNLYSLMTKNQTIISRISDGLYNLDEVASNTREQKIFLDNLNKLVGELSKAQNLFKIVKKNWSQVILDLKSFSDYYTKSDFKNLEISFIRLSNKLKESFKQLPKTKKLLDKLESRRDLMLTKSGAKKIVSKMGMVADKNLGPAIRSGNEIILTGTYYAFKADIFGTALLSWFATLAR